MEERIDFDLFKSNVCHRVKYEGDLVFIKNIKKNNKIEYYFDKKWYLESLYLLAMIDYLSRENNLKLCKKYDYLRNIKFENPVFPTGIKIKASLFKNKKIKEKSLEECIPEFLRHNIVEAEIRNVC